MSCRNKFAEIEAQYKHGDREAWGNIGYLIGEVKRLRDANNELHRRCQQAEGIEAKVFSGWRCNNSHHIILVKEKDGGDDIWICRCRLIEDAGTDD